MELIIKKKEDRINWSEKLMTFQSVTDAKKWQIEEYKRCKNDKVYWVNQYLWTVDARKTPAIVPFILYDFQIDLVKQLDKFGDTFIDKSRQMGVSWTVMAWELHNVLYTRGFSALNISKKEEAVEDAGKTHHSLHGRLFFMYSRLPPYLKPKIHNPTLVFRTPSMDSVIKGESSNPKAGRDSQYKFILIDEAAHIDCLDEMWKGCRSATNSICLNSTPPKSKVNNKFAEIKEMKNSGFTHISFHWSQHPEYTPEWYARKTASMTQEEIAQELEINYDASLTNRSYPEFKDEVHLMDHKFNYHPNFPLYCFMDFGLSGEVFLFAQKDFQDRLFFFYYRIFKEKLTKELYQELLKCLGHIKYTKTVEQVIFIGDKSGTKRHRTSKTSVIDEYNTVSGGKMNILYRMDLTNEDKMKDMKNCLKTFVDGKPQFNVSNETTCLKFAEAMKNLVMNNAKTDHVDNDLTHVVNAAEYGVSYLVPRKKEVAVVVSCDPSNQQEFENRIKSKALVGGQDKIASVSSIIRSHGSRRKGVIF